MDVPCPHVQGRIIIKALRLPQGVWPKYHKALQQAQVMQQTPSAQAAHRLSDLNPPDGRKFNESKPASNLVGDAGQLKATSYTAQKAKSQNFLADPYQVPSDRSTEVP